MKGKVQKETNHSIYLFNETAAFTYDGYINFHIDTFHSDNHIGSSLNKEHKDIILSKNKVTNKVRCVDVANMIKKKLSI